MEPAFKSGRKQGPAAEQNRGETPPQARRPARKWEGGIFDDVRVRYGASGNDGSNAAPIQMRVTFNYDYFYRNIRGRQAALSPAAANEYLDFCGFDQEIALLNKLLPNDQNVAELNEQLTRIKGYVPNLPATGSEFRKAVGVFIGRSNELYGSFNQSGLNRNNNINFLIENQYQNRPEYRPEAAALGTTQTGLHEMAYGPLAGHPAHGLALVQVPKISPLNKGSSEIPVLPFTRVQAKVPPGLANLMRDIYLSWHGYKAFDMRTETERANKSTTPLEPGSLRSYHMNMTGSLPSPFNAGERKQNTLRSQGYMAGIREATVLNTIGAHGRGIKMHTDYKEHSKMEGGAALRQVDAQAGGGGEHPVGYAEYTGIGFGGEPHECKIVFNYIFGKLYLTLTHYQYYTIRGGDVHSEGQTPTRDAYSPWIQVDMEH